MKTAAEIVSTSRNKQNNHIPTRVIMTGHFHQPPRRVHANPAQSIRLVLHAALLTAAPTPILGCMIQPAPRPAAVVCAIGLLGTGLEEVL